MNIEISVTPNKIWGFFRDNKSRLEKEMVQIAQNKTNGRTVYLTEAAGKPYLAAYDGDALKYEGALIDERDAVDCTKSLYKSFLFPVQLVVVGDNELPGEYEEQEVEEEHAEFSKELDRQILEDQIYEREDELYLALKDFLDVVTEGQADLYEEEDEDELQGILDDILIYLSGDHGIPVRRPLFVTDKKTGTESLIEYPYELDFDEDDKK